MIKIYKYGEVPNNEIFARVVPTMNVEGIVADILQNVKTRGDEALKGYAEKFDGVRLDALEVAREEIDEAYEENTGRLIVSEFQRLEKDPMAVLAVLCKNHGPFSWGKDAFDAVHNAVVLEEVAKMAINTKIINPTSSPVGKYLLDKHYLRKHGKNAYYGQK